MTTPPPRPPNGHGPYPGGTAWTTPPNGGPMGTPGPAGGQTFNGQQGAPDNSQARATRRRMTAAGKTTHRTVDRSKHKAVHVSINKPAGAGPAAPAGGPAQAQGGQSTPGGDFMSNEDIRAFSEHVRKEARNRAVERSMDAEQLQAVLRHIPDVNGSKSGARARARRVARHLKLIAAAEKIIARQAAALYAAFEREFESDLRKVGKGRAGRNAPPRAPFTWT